jgi:hypothetical protein
MMPTPPPPSRTTRTKKIICLANSRKLKGRCIAGIEFSDALDPVWIRPVTTSPTGEIPEIACAYSLGQPINVLDVLEVRLVESRAKGYQQENWLIDQVRPWTHIGRAVPADIEKAISMQPTLWTNGSSSKGGVNDRIDEAAIGNINSSLQLVKVDQLYLEVKAPYEGAGPPDLRASFVYKQNHYNLKVTDPRYEASYRSKSVGTYAIRTAYLTISLAEPYKGFVYKLVAAIIDPKLL